MGSRPPVRSTSPLDIGNVVFRESARILGWPLFIGALPALLYSHFIRGDFVNFDAYYDPPEATREWDALAFCSGCRADTDQLYVEWRYPGHIVTRECTECGNIVEIEDERD